MKRTFFGRFLFLFLLAVVFALSSCSHSTCPTYDDNAGASDNAPSGKGKAKTSLFPSNMK